MTSTIHTKVMRRVRTIHALRSATTGAGAAALIIILSLYLIGREVWVARILQNMPSIAHVQSFATFFTYAFTHTHLAVQVLVLCTIAAGLWLLRELARLLVVSLPRTQFSA